MILCNDCCLLIALYVLVFQTKEYLKDPSKFAAVTAAAAPAASSAPAAEAKKEESEEESDDDMGFGLFD